MAQVNEIKADEIPVGTMKSFEVWGKEVLVVNYGGKFYAIADRCTHGGGDLSKGKLDGNIVTCPLHGSKFDVTTGKCISGPKIGFFKIKAKDETVYKVEVEDNKIKIAII